MFNGILFQQSLQDLVKGIRAHRRDEDDYIRSKVAEIGDECRSADMAKKTTAVLKLTHLQMMGHSISFASFHVIEVMSSPVFASKRIGYLAAAQSFSPTTDVLLLTTNQFKKDLTNGKLQDCSQALTCLAKLVTEELGRDLEHDVSLLLNSPRPYVRKKALLVLYRLIMVHPDTLPIVSTRFRDRLTDQDPGVICAAVTVTCELARASPRSFLSLAPVLYQLLTNKESNNWMLIKIVKLMGVLTPLEPRLGKKLVEPLTTLMRTTGAKSLLYECCSTVTAGLMAYPEAVELCAQRLGEFMDESDQNLKYLGLLSMRKLIQAHPHLALEHRDNILDCLDDEDIGIRMRALELVSEFVTKRTLRDISRILLKKLRKASADGFNMEGALASGSAGLATGDNEAAYTPVTDQEAPYRESLARQLLRAGEYRRSTQAAKAGYEMLSTGDDFAWYTTAILGGLAELRNLSNDVRGVVGDQLLELTSRVEALRPISVKVSLSLLSARRNSTVEDGPPAPAEETVSRAASTEVEQEPADASSAEGVTEDGPEDAPRSPAMNGEPDAEEGEKVVKPVSEDAILSSSLAGSTAWILGEYSELIEDHVEATTALVAFPHKALDAAGHVRVLTACVKVYSSCPNSVAFRVCQLLSQYVESLTDSQFAEVQERAWFFKAILKDVLVENRGDLLPLFEGKLIPVDHRAQSKIPIADDLDLEKPLLDTGSDSLFTYLLKTIGSVEDEEEVGEEDDSLFKEAVFASTTLSFTGAQPSSTSSFSNHTTLLGSLPEANKGQSPYYLGGSSAGSSSTRQVSKKPDDHDTSISQYNYQTGHLSSEAAVVIAEESPLGVDLTDDEKESVLPGAPPMVDERLQAAFEGAFDEPGTNHIAKREGKRKKKKKKDGKEKKERKEKKGKEPSGESVPEVSLIDFDATPTASSSVEGAVSSARPKHLADALLM